MNEKTYNIKVTCIREDLFEAVIEKPALRVEASTLDGVLQAIERAVARALMEADRQAQSAARAS
jgi:hypothetical protein